MSATISFSVEPSWPIDFCGAFFTVMSFTDERYFPLTWRRKERSRMTQYWRLLWVIQAAGETLSVGWSLSLIVLYSMIFAKPFCTLVCAFKRRKVLEYVDVTNMWEPCIIDAYIWSVDHVGPHLTGKNSVENDCIRGFSLWWVAYVCGHMSPILPILSLIFSASSMDLSLLIACFVAIFWCWDVWSKEFMSPFVSAGAVDGGFRLYPLAVLGTDVIPLSEVWNSTCW